MKKIPILLVFITISLLGFLAPSWSSASPYAKMNLEEMRRELFGNAYQSMHRKKTSDALTTLSQKVVQTSCWIDVWKMAKKASLEGKTILFASDVDDTIIRLFTLYYLQDFYREFGRYPRPALYQAGVDAVINDFISDSNIDFIAITKRSRDLHGKTHKDLRGNGIDLLIHSNEIILSDSDLNDRSYLSKRNAYYQNIISTSSESKGNYLVDFINSRQKNYDLVFFIDDKKENCQDVLEVVQDETNIQVISLHYQGHSYKCSNSHNPKNLNVDDLKEELNLGILDVDSDDDEDEDFIDLR